MGFALAALLSRRRTPEAKPRPPSDETTPFTEAAFQAVAELQETDKELAEAIAAPAVVKVQETPAIIDEKQQVSESLLNKALERVTDETLRRTLKSLAGWRPRSSDGSEHGYVGSMLRYMTRNGVSTKEIEREKRIKYKEEDTHWAQPDVVVANRVLVEVKADLDSSSASDRSLGQMLRYLLKWKFHGPAILVVCGRCDAFTSLLVRHYVESWRTTLRLPVTVWFARQGSSLEVEDRVHSPDADQTGP
jgi:hypothetical protein